jgi:phospholipase C
MMDRKAFDRVFIIIFENQLADNVMQNAYMKSLATDGIYLYNYHGITHPSQPNYIASIAGSTMGVDDDSSQDLDGGNIVDLLEAKGVSWKAYMEDLPEDDKSTHKEHKYYRKHNPFISFNNNRNNPARLERIVEAKQLAIDVQNNSLPQYCWYTPNIENDGHSIPIGFEFLHPLRSVNFLARWLQGFLTPLLAEPNFAKGTLIVITFDESLPHDDNHVYTVLLGDMVNPKLVETERYNHYSLLRTIEENFDLGTLGREDQTANWFRFLWGLDEPTFDWADHAQ